MSYFKYTLFTLFKLPAAWITGVRLTHLDDHSSTASIKHRWINQNPYKSMFWAVQGMAAELSTGALLMMKIKASNKSISMLVVNNKASFSKKAKGLITFSCTQGAVVDTAIEKAIATGEGQLFYLTAAGVDKHGDEVSSFEFEWSVKVKS